MFGIVKKNEIIIKDIRKLINSLSDEDVDITSIEFTGNNSIRLHMSKTISTIHTTDKKASLNELMSLIEQMKNYDAIKNEDTKTDFTP